jgi:glyoxylase-like metal-dependent hydrolase (beta-lactamase superfamily II)
MVRSDADFDSQTRGSQTRGSQTRGPDADTPDRSAAVPLPSDIAMQTIVMVNVAFIGEPGTRDWVLVDAGLPMSASRILAAARERYGDVPPRAILLTHGHFDHVGALRTLVDTWDVPIYAHTLELPYLTGKSSYPPPDPTVGGGVMARLSPLFPKGPEDFSDRIEPLPDDGTVPHAPGWRWIATPGHSPGHVSFFRESDGTLIVGDAFIMQKQESLVGALSAAEDFRGPPRYFTPDWGASRESVRRLADLKPRLAITGHGHAIGGTQLMESLQDLAEHFDERSVPNNGRYTREPAVTDESGVVSLPPAVEDSFNKYALLGVALALGAVFALACRASSERPKEASSSASSLRRPLRD